MQRDHVNRQYHYRRPVGRSPAATADRTCGSETSRWTAPSRRRAACEEQPHTN